MPKSREEKTIAPFSSFLLCSEETNKEPTHSSCYYTSSSSSSSSSSSLSLSLSLFLLPQSGFCAHNVNQKCQLFLKVNRHAFRVFVCLRFCLPCVPRAFKATSLGHVARDRERERERKRKRAIDGERNPPGVARARRERERERERIGKARLLSKRDTT